MNTIDLEELGRNFRERYDTPTPLFSDGPHAVYWLGWPEDTAFRCNAYLIADGDEALIVDPGGVSSFGFILNRVSQITDPLKVTAMILSHQDPDVAACMVNWLDLNPQIRIITSVRTNLLLPHYGRSDYEFININEDPDFTFSSGRKVRFIESPFLHFPGAFTSFDETSGFLLSGDIWAAIDMDWHLVVSDFRNHELKLNLFHLDYMAGNVAVKGFLSRIRSLDIKAILPQHGSIIPERFVAKAKHYLSELRCGTDLIYPDLR
ncbi:MAG TPA: MBL fold metallo-hydrolase [Bacteroidales bacterium]|nr:MBL fold metallo-hydrolase [Bacteroidales bacterium]HPS51174.1 MBL fold metallo-hydrolase [Bacteroidales bacterium]